MDACLFLLDRDEKNSPVNIGSQDEVSIRELAEMMCEVVGYKGNLVFDTSKQDGMPLKKVDTSKIDALGWKARTTLKEGLLSLYQWFLQSRFFEANKE